MMMLSPPIGVIFGYTQTALFVSFGGWNWSFFVLGVLSSAFFVILLFVPSKYLEIKEVNEVLKKEREAKREKGRLELFQR